MSQSQNARWRGKEWEAANILSDLPNAPVLVHLPQELPKLSNDAIDELWACLRNIPSEPEECDCDEGDYDDGYDEGYDVGYDEGHDEGYDKAKQEINPDHFHDRELIEALQARGYSVSKEGA